MRHSYSAGGVVLNAHGQILLINEGGDFWGLPKGRRKDAETPIETARREIKEEAGVDQITLLKELGQYERHAYNSGNEDKTELKHITLFLFAAKVFPATLQNVENNQTLWVEPARAAQLLTHPEDRAFLLEKLADITHAHI